MKSVAHRLSRRAVVIVGTALLATLALSTSRTHAQDRPWRVWMKVGPCAETLVDWMSVAHENPSGGLSQFELARHPNGPSAVTFPGTAQGFQDAMLMADQLRLGGFMGTSGAKYETYCCRVWDVWSGTSGGAKNFTTVRSPGTPGPNFPFNEKSQQCCENAASLAGGKGACAFFRLSNGRVVHFTDNGPAVIGGALMINGVIFPQAKNLPSNICAITGGNFTAGQSPPVRGGVVSSEHACTHTLTPTDSTVRLAQSPRNGTVTINGTKWTYKSNAGFTGQDGFAVLFTNKSGKSSTLTYAFTVLGRL